MKLLIVFLISLLVTGCDETKYSLVIDNRSDENLSEIIVWYDTKVLSVGAVSVSANSHSTNSGTKPKLMDEMKITWVDADNIAHEKLFNTFNYIPHDYNGGNVIFVYEGGQFVLKFHLPKNDFPTLIKD